MHKMIFYPVGNGDTSQIVLENGKRILLDYRHLSKSEDDEGPEINLKAQLQRELAAARKNSFDVVALTHGDEDHICGSTDFFELRHAAKYQGGSRILIDELWVPAAMILEEGEHSDRGSEFVIWRQEARFRLREGKGIRVFSKPNKLKAWLANNGLPLESRRHLITDAGQIAPGFSLADDGVEFFCHSPFIKHVDGGDDLRNDCSLIFNIRFASGSNTFDYLAVGDSTWSVLEDIVDTTLYHKNNDRLAWDLFNIPHHCSYKALSDDKGLHETVPKLKVDHILRQGREGSYIVSSSCPIEDTDEGRARVQPPHIQARKCYQRYLREIDGGRFLVTMEEPTTTKPEPIVFLIAESGISIEKVIKSAPAVITSDRPPRAG